MNEDIRGKWNSQQKEKGQNQVGVVARIREYLWGANCESKIKMFLQQNNDLEQILY